MLHHLPHATGVAAENMALDLLLLENYPIPGVVRFRHYDWSEPAFTFGLSQSWTQVRATTPAHCTLVRRPTGGGVVSHLDDWTYTVVLPFAHPLCRAHATDSYKAIHQALAGALLAQGIPAALEPCPAESCDAPGVRPPAHKPGVCFVAPEIFDVVRSEDGQKIAGAAQKRNRHGLLLQGSIAKAVAGPGVDWGRFEQDFVMELARTLAVTTTPLSFPQFDPALLATTTARFSDPKWNTRH